MPVWPRAIRTLRKIRTPSCEAYAEPMLSEFAVVVATGVHEESSLRIATIIFIVVVVVVVVGYRLYRMRKNRSNQEFFERMRPTSKGDPPAAA